jgi:hypothetical protein
MIQFVFAADKLQILSILTLVHRAVPPPMGSLTTFTQECIDSARAAVEARQEYAPIPLAGTEASLSAFMNW